MNKILIILTYRKMIKLFKILGLMKKKINKKTKSTRKLQQKSQTQIHYKNSYNYNNNKNNLKKVQRDHHRNKK